ncbi:MAG TPA: serine hydrolase domain-containing protein [Burkholderiales bacterium]|nr:serine hydrolase domain-containing protein [Burkholderiales bacterium]
MKQRIAVIFLSLVAALLGACAATQTATPESVGVSTQALAKLGSVLQAEIAAGGLPGTVMLISRHGKVVHFEADGMRDKEAGVPMTKDSIFRMASMTKPITSVAIMMLVEAGKINIADPASKYLPELKGLQVGVESKDAAGNTVLTRVPARRELTVQDLLRHTSGLTYGHRGASSVLVKKTYVDAGEQARDHTNAELVTKLSKTVLAFQPGTRWEYGRSTDVLGRIVEVVSGMTLGQFFEARIFKPLGMVDSFFSVPADKVARVAHPMIEPATGKRPNVTDPRQAQRFESGGGGLFSTAPDYLRFTTMLLNGGELDGVRLLSPKTVEHMASDHLGAVPGSNYPGFGFGLGFAVRTHTGMNDMPGSVGEYLWGGAQGTWFWIDPKEKLIAIFMSQRAGDARIYYRRLVKNLVAQTLR